MKFPSENRNSAVIKNGLEQFRAQIRNYIWERLTAVLPEVWNSIVKNKEYSGLTGNTQTSYMVGIYYGKELRTFKQGMWTAPAIRKKIPNGQHAFVSKPYEGFPRGVIGMSDTDNKYGVETSQEFLESYRCPEGSFAFVVTTGTEYSGQWLEAVLHLNVLSLTGSELPNLISQSFKSKSLK
jgi:hypothetical protein